MEKIIGKDESPKKRKAHKDLSVFGGARSLLGNAKNGGMVIGEGVREITEATKRSMKPSRHETFEMAISRLGVGMEWLPIIHNQLVLQTYLTFFVGIAAIASAINLIIQGSTFASLVAILISLASFAKTIQSSMQCEFIRERRLGIGAQWWSKPSVWLPSRMDGMILMSKNDPIRNPELVSELAKNSVKFFEIALLLLAIGIGSYFLFDSWGWPLVLMTVSVVLIGLGANLSFEVYKRRIGATVDLLPWLFSASSWIPAVNVKKSTEKASDEKFSSGNDENKVENIPASEDQKKEADIV